MTFTKDILGYLGMNIAMGNAGCKTTGHENTFMSHGSLLYYPERSSRQFLTSGPKVSMKKTMIVQSPTVIFAIHAKTNTKWGVRLWVCADADTAHIHSFEVYTGKSDLGVEHGLAYIVMYLLKDLLDSGRTFYTDNFYTSPILYQDLRICASRTCRSNKKHFPKSIFPGAVAIAEGESVFQHCGSLTCGWWLDKRDVLLISTLYRDEFKQVER